MQCIKCGSDKIIEDQNIVYFSHGNIEKNLSIAIQKTDRAFFNSFEKGDFLAQICCDCGHVELTVNNPNALWEAYQETKK
jgi:predicted nucleic-acid-binding Zn-ribbon protein